MDFSGRTSPAVKSLAIFGFVSLVHALLARIVMTKFFFDYPIVLIMFNMALTLSLVELGRLTRLIKVQAYTFHRGKDMFLPSFFYSLSQYISLSCLDGITLPFFPFLQKFFALLVVPFYIFFWRRQRPSVQTLFVLLLLCLGSAMSSVFEVSFDLWGLGYSLAALLMLTASLVLMERLHAQQNTSPLELIYLNSFNCLCLFLIADIIQDEVRDAYMYLQTSTTTVFYVCLCALVVMGAIAHAAMLHCVATANTLNTAVMHNCAAVVQVLVAYVLSIEVFYDSEPNSQAIFGVLLALAATLFYFISGKDRELKPSANGCCVQQPGAMLGNGIAKYHLLAKS